MKKSLEDESFSVDERIKYFEKFRISKVLNKIFISLWLSRYSKKEDLITNDMKKYITGKITPFYEHSMRSSIDWVQLPKYLFSQNNILIHITEMLFILKEGTELNPMCDGALIMSILKHLIEGPCSSLKWRCLCIWNSMKLGIILSEKDYKNNIIPSK
jgi:hypothetical protein